MPPEGSSRAPTRSSRKRTLPGSDKPDRKAVLYGVDPSPAKVRDHWERQGYGGPRGDLHLRVLRNAADRKPNILGDEPATFPVDGNPQSNSKPPGHYLHSAGRDAVAEHAKEIEAAAKRHGVDASLVKAIVYAENSRGWYDMFTLGFEDTIRPMNIDVGMWEALGVPVDAAKSAKDNIDLGVRLIQRLTARVPGASAGQIGTLYNSLAKEKVSDFGSHVQTIYNQKLWEKKEGTPMSLGYRAGDLARRALDYIVD